MKMRRLTSTLNTRIAIVLVVFVLCPSLLILCSSGPLRAAEPEAAEPGGEIPVVNAPDVMISATRTPTSIGNVNQSEIGRAHV